MPALKDYCTSDDFSSKLDGARQAAIKAKARRLAAAVQLRALREQQNLTQTQVAANMGIAPCNVNRLEMGEKEIKLSTLKDFVEALGGTLNITVELPSGTFDIKL